MTHKIHNFNGSSNLRLPQYDLNINFVSLCFFEPELFSAFRLDYCGIALLTMGSFVPWLYYSFYCRLGPKIAYLVLIFILGTCCIVVSLWDKFAEPEFRGVRAGMLLWHFQHVCRAVTVKNIGERWNITYFSLIFRPYT